MNLCSRWKCVVIFTPRPHYLPTKETPVRIEREVGWPQNQSWRFGEEKKYRTAANQTTITRSSNTQYFHYFDRDIVLSYSDLFVPTHCWYSGLFLQLITLNDTQIHTHSVGLLSKRNRPDAETSNWQHTTLTRNKQPCTRRDSNSQSQQASGRRPMS